MLLNHGDKNFDEREHFLLLFGSWVLVQSGCRHRGEFEKENKK